MISQHFKNMAATALIVVTAFTILGTTVWGDIVSVIQKSKEQTLGVPIDRAVVIESAVPFAELSIANPAIADFSTLSDRTIYILGKLAGTTTLTLIDKKGNLISNVQIKVTTDLNELRKRLKEILPNEKIKVRSANDGIVLHGKVSTAEASDKAVLLANRYAPNLVSNLLDIESLTRKALITQTYTIETNHNFSGFIHGTEKSAVKILSPAELVSLAGQNTLFFVLVYMLSDIGFAYLLRRLATTAYFYFSSGKISLDFNSFVSVTLIRWEHLSTRRTSASFPKCRLPSEVGVSQDLLSIFCKR